MKLSEVKTIAEYDVLADGEFEAIGLLSHCLPKLLVMFYDMAFLQRLIGNPHISCVITRPDIAASLPAGLGVAVCSDPMAAFYKVHDYLMAETDFYGQSFRSEISPDAVIHETAFVAPHAVRIGGGTRIGPRAVILEKTVIGENVVIGPGAVIGGEGFEPKFVAGRHILIRHAGGVLLHNGVEILANSHVAKSLFNGYTEIGEGTKIDAMVHISHNVKVGRNCEIAASALVAGSSTIGERVWIGPHTVISSEVRVGDRAFVAIGAVAVKDVAADERVFGVPARSMRARSDS
jgi:UDP-3-O-[3-hydroxymyristoyl] glucosamine N-acyltransferase